MLYNDAVRLAKISVKNSGSCIYTVVHTTLQKPYVHNRLVGVHMSSCGTYTLYSCWNASSVVVEESRKDTAIQRHNIIVSAVCQPAAMVSLLYVLWCCAVLVTIATPSLQAKHGTVLISCSGLDNL